VATFQKPSFQDWLKAAVAAMPDKPGAGLAETTNAPDWSTAQRQEAGKLPFKPAPPAPPVPRGAGAPTMKLPVAPSDVAGTLPLGADLSAYMRPVVPFAEETMGGGQAPYPKWELNTYASFCAQLEAAPEEKEALMDRYGVRGEPSRVALDKHWQEAFAANAQRREVFDALFKQYLAYARSVKK
jgi:hypothetical protein